LAHLRNAVPVWYKHNLPVSYCFSLSISVTLSLCLTLSPCKLLQIRYTHHSTQTKLLIKTNPIYQI